MNEGKVDCEINGSIASIFFDRPEYDDLIIDGLRVSSSTDFC